MRVFAGGSVADECAGLRLHAEHRAGQMLAAMELNKGAATERGAIVAPRLDVLLGAPTLDAAKHWSRRWQAIATIPEGVIDDYPRFARWCVLGGLLPAPGGVSPRRCGVRGCAGFSGLKA